MSLRPCWFSLTPAKLIRRSPQITLHRFRAIHLLRGSVKAIAPGETAYFPQEAPWRSFRFQNAKGNEQSQRSQREADKREATENGLELSAQFC